MSRFSHIDILVELTELCQEIMAEIAQQLIYYRASVYKQEMGQQLEPKLGQLRTVAEMIGDRMILEPFHDYDAMANANPMNYVPGECSLSVRVSCLLKGLEDQLGALNHRLHTQRDGFDAARDLPKTVQRRRKELMAICRQGSRHHLFFQTL